MSLTLRIRRLLQCWECKAVRCHAHQHWRGGGYIRRNNRSRQRNIEFAILNSVYRLRLTMSTIHQMCEAKYATVQSTDDDSTQHYEFNWCLRSPLGGRLLMQRVTQYRHDVLRTRCYEQARGNSPLQFLPAPFGVCFGKAAIIRPRAPHRDDNS